MESEINKILIKMPKLGEQVILTFPFITLISEEFPKAEIDIIIEEGDEVAFNFLPFKVKTVVRPKEKKNLIETHHFVVNANEIFNVDLFFDLENSFNSAFMGYNFRARERVGFDLGWNKHLLTSKYKSEFEDNIERRSIRLLELYFNKNFSEFRLSSPIGDISSNENIDQLFKDPIQPKYILIMLDNFTSATKEIELWKSFFDSFENQNFIIWTLENEDIISDIFSKIDLGKNTLYMHRGALTKELNFIFKKVTGVVTNNIWGESLCNYYNLPYITFITRETKLPQYQYFRSRPIRIFFKENIPTNVSHLDDEKQFTTMNEVVDYIHFTFKL